MSDVGCDASNKVVPGERVKSSAVIGLSKYSSVSCRESVLSRSERNIADLVAYGGVALPDRRSSSKLLEPSTLSTLAESVELLAWYKVEPPSDS